MQLVGSSTFDAIDEWFDVSNDLPTITTKQSQITTNYITKQNSNLTSHSSFIKTYNLLVAQSFIFGYCMVGHVLKGRCREEDKEQNE